LPAAKQGLSRVGARQVRVLEMTQGNKISRVLAWSFQDEVASRQWWSPMAHDNV
ncbi:RlmF-related methyltransferase, partial [Aeromonas hydrophila]